jgi:radical SAM superfamily enzyme YgiQ (UPF0313 family)
VDDTIVLVVLKSTRIALLCIDPWDDQQGVSPHFRPFNYSVRKVQAALLHLPNVEVHLVESSSTDPEPMLAQLEKIKPDIVGASAYVWSFPTFIKVAQELKKQRPECLIVFGGPSARTAMFALPPYRDGHTFVDALALSEGEELIRELASLTDRSRAHLKSVTGLAVATEQGWHLTEKRELPALGDLPSPFQSGLVPEGMSGHLETFRGCPLSCAFCQWGDYGGTRVFSTEYLVKELLAMKQAKARGVFLVDAALNLNPRAFRNLRAAEQQVRVLKGMHFHAEIYPAHMTDDYLHFLQEIEADAVGIGLQSYDKEVLKTLHRPFDDKRFEQVVRDVCSIVPNVHVELIMGLPGDRPDAFRQTFERVRELPVSVRIYRCLVLPDALMTRAPAHLEMQFDPITLEMQQCTGWTQKDIESTVAALTEQLHREDGYMGEGVGAWSFHPTKRKVISAHTSITEEVTAALQQAIAQASHSQWTLERTEHTANRVLIHLRTQHDSIVLQAAAAQPNQPAFQTFHGIAFGYRGQSIASSAVPTLSAVIEQIHPIVARLLQLQSNPRRALPMI